MYIFMVFLAFFEMVYNKLHSGSLAISIMGKNILHLITAKEMYHP